MMTEDDVIQLAARIFEEQGHPVARQEEWLVHRHANLVFGPHLVTTQSLKDGRVHSVTTITTLHPKLPPDGVFEFQHGVGRNLPEAIRSGFEQWCQQDLPVLTDIDRDKAENCTILHITYPPRDDAPVRNRRALLGPVAHFRQPAPPGTMPDVPAEEDHPFCPCCLLTNTFAAFRPFVDADEFFAIRLVAVRNAGSPQADCRINGHDWEEGRQALCEYASRWPPSRYEMRKQYVVLQSIDARRVRQGAC